MTRQDTQMLKGIAILMMIFYHLFNQEQNVSLCQHLIVIGETPLAFILSKATNPVAFFLILGGYGMYKAYEKGDKHRIRRILKLYVHYWVILLAFLSLGYCLRPDRYPGSICEFMANATGYHTTYNGEMWFLLPYVVLTLSSKWLFKLWDRFKARFVVGSTFLIHLVTSYLISRHGASFLYSNYWIYDPLLVFHLMFSFSLGYVAARYHFFERTRQYFKRKKTALLSLGGVIILVSISCVFKYNFLYAFGVITCLLLLPIPVAIKKMLQTLGDHSMNIWMIHSWLCYYLFHDFIYSFSYPLLIFIILVSISLVISLLINFMVRPLEKIIFEKSRIAKVQSI